MTSTEAEVARPRNGRRPEIPRWDQELRHAKNTTSLVKFTLAVEAYFADEDCVCIGTILDVDKNGVRANIEGREIWITRSFIISTEVLADA